MSKKIASEERREESISGIDSERWLASTGHPALFSMIGEFVGFEIRKSLTECMHFLSLTTVSGLTYRP